MSPSRINIARLLLILAIVASSGVVMAESQDESQTSVVRQQAEDPFEERPAIAPPRDGITVYTGQSTPATTGAITALSPDGRLLYFNETFDNYFDVDPVPGTSATVEYVAASIVSPTECHATTSCIKNYIIRVNLSTGAQRLVFSTVHPIFTTLDGQRIWNGKIHDFERINDTHLVIADIGANQVYVVNTSSGVRTWVWDAAQSYPRTAGGEYPGDWTHINDVEVLEDGRIMVSLRNFDRVVFLKRDGSVDRSWTLGAEDEYTILYEQHNPDYINDTMGGPAVLVADSENNRVVEYRRDEKTWTRSWSWADDRLQWPRDADRLPNGHTLVTDTHGGRIIEIDESGQIVWQVESATPYEAERLSTPAESRDGPAANRIGLASRGDTSPSADEPGGATLARIRNVAGFVLPDFFTFRLVLATGILGAACVGLAGLELHIRGIRVTLKSPIQVQRRN